MAIPATQALLHMNADLLGFLTQSLDFTPALCNCLSLDGYNNSTDFVDWTYAEISKYCEVKSTKTIARGGCNWPDRKKKDLQGFAFYVTQRSLEGVQVNTGEVDGNGDHVLTLVIVREYYEAAKIAEDKGDEVEKKKPDVLKSEDWVEWEKSIIHYLNGMRNRRGVPLSYVIRGAQPQNVQLTSDEQKIHAAALNGPQFNNDSKEVYNLIKELVQNTDGDSWLPARCSCGRTAMQSLRNHYDGPDQAKARIDVARASIEKLFYRNENMFSFESYSTQMKKNYDVLEKYNQPEYEANKIDTFLKGIRNENNKVVNVVSIARTMVNLNTFQLVQEFISNQLKTIFPPHEIQQAGKRNERGGRRGVSATKKSKKKAAKRKAARIAKLSITGRNENGVQLEGYDHYYSNKDFYALTKDTRDAILKARKDNNWVPGNRDNGNRNVNATATADRNDDDMSSVGHSLAGRTITMDASVLRGVMAASSSTGDQQQQSNPPANGSHARSVASAAIQVAKRIGLGWTERSATGHFKPSLDAYDCGFLDKAVEWVNFAWSNRKIIRYRDVCRIKTSDRKACSIDVSPLSAASRYENPLPTEMDNHADTHCFGKNFIILEYTRQQCSVAPFLAEYDETQNIDIVTGATAVDLEDGSTVICVFGQGLWFGDRMEKSLINPNQCRHYGVSLCDDPTDPHRPLAIRKERFSISMQMFNSSCGFESRRPTMEELESCPRVTLSDKHSWNPETVSFQISSLKEEQRTKHDWSWEHSKLDLPLSRLVSLVERPHGVQVPVFRDDTFISDFDRGLCHASSGLAQDLAVDSLANSVKVQLQDSARIALASTEKRHHEVTKELLAKKWGISIARAEATLKASTQLSEEQRTKHDWSWEHSKLDLPLSRLVSLVERPHGVQVPVFRDDTFISDFDRGLCHASSGLAQDLAVDSLANSVKVQLQDSARIALASTEKRHHEVTKELLAKKWGISIARAEATLKASTQLSVRSAIMPLSRRYRTDLLSQRLRRISTRVYTDTLLMKTKSSRSNTCAQVFTDGALAYVHPMQSKADAHEGLVAFGQDVGIPMEMISDNSKEQTEYGSDFMKILRKWRTSSRSIEPYSPWQNLAENVIGILKSKWKRRMVRRNVPAKVWDFGLVWEAEIYARTAKPGGRTGIEAVTGETPDISEWLDFEFYDLCWYWDSLESKRKLGRWLGVSHRVGSAMCYWILSSTGNVLARTTVQHVLQSECNQEEIQEQIRAYHQAVSDAFGIDNFVSDLDGFDRMINEDVPLVKEAEPGYTIHDDIAVLEIDDVVDHDDAVKQQDTYDMYIGAEVLFPNAVGDERMGKVVKKLRKNDGNSSNTGSYNPLHDTALYQVEFPSGLTESIQANIIAENMFAQVDSEGHHQQVLKEISDHSWDHTAIPRWDGFIKTKSGMVPKKTTRGWELLVEWKDGTMSWVPLKDLKNSNPVELAQYAVMNALEEEPAFKWWVPYTLKKRDAIVAKVKSKYWRTTHKFGIRIPKSADEAYKLDAISKTTFWTDAINKEMENVRVAFEVLAGVTPEEMRTGKVRPGYKEIPCHMIFDIKMDGKFTRKARLVAGGHVTDPPSAITYSSVVSRDSVRIALTIASLNDLDLFACDVESAYLCADCLEKVWCVAGSEFGSDKGKVLLIVRALYGLKSSGAAWRAMLAKVLREEMNFVPTEADPDVYIRQASKANGELYYEMLLVYVDDILAVSEVAEELVGVIGSKFKLKKSSVGRPSRYLGGGIERIQTDDGRVIWSANCMEYVRSAIDIVKEDLSSDPMPLHKRGDGKRPFPSSYRPELDTSPELEDISKYQQYIGVLRWACELGRIDILTEVSVLSQHLCNPREGHLDAVDKRDDVDAVEQPSNVVQVKSSPQLENKNADSSKKEEIDLKLSDFSDEKPSPPRKLSVSSSLSEAAKLQKTDALVEATSASVSASASAIALPKEKKQTFEIPVPGKKGAIPNALNGKIFVLTGVFPELGEDGRNKCTTMIESFGGKVRSSISGKTNYLVVGKEPGPSKYNQAKAKGFPMLDLRELRRLMFGETTLEASSSGSISMSSGSVSSVASKSVVIDRGASGSSNGGSMIVSSGASNASGYGGSMTLLSGSSADMNGGAVSLTSGSGLVEGGAVSISSGSGSFGDISMSSGASSLAESGSITFSSSAGVAGSTNSGGLTLSSGSTLNGASGAVTISSRSTKLIPCTIKADPQGHAQVKNIVTSMVRGGEHPSYASVVEKYPNIGQKYIKTSLQGTISYYRRLAEKETNDKADLKENESDSDDDDSLEQLIERCRSNGVNLDLTRSNAVPQQHKVAALKFVQKHGVHKQCMGDLKDALLKEMLLIAEEIGFEMKGVDLNRYIKNRISWARSLSGKPNTSVGPLLVAKREEKRKEDQEALDAYLKECDRELFDERKSEKEMISIFEEFINSHIEEFGMSFDEAVKTLTLTLYGGITGQLNTDSKKCADTEAFRWTYSSKNANPVLVNADGIGIGKKRAEEEFGFKVMSVFESICFDNAALFEKLFHLKYQHLPLGRVRCWRVAGAGQRSSIVRGQYKVFITYSTEVQAAIDAGKIEIGD